MKEQPTLHQLYLDVTARKRRKERIAYLAVTIVLALATCMFCVALVSPQP